jgi:hypothetical protein
MFGSIIQPVGVMVIPPPPSLAPGVTASNAFAFAFAEQQNLVLPVSVHAAITQPGTYICCGAAFSGGNVAAGLDVDSYMLFADPLTGSGGNPWTLFTGSVTFSAGEQVVGIVIGYSELSKTDALLGAPGTLYNPNTDIYAGLQDHDAITLAYNSATNEDTVSFKLYVTPNHDNEIRILTAIPEPGVFFLIGGGLLAIFGLFKVRTRRLARASIRQ